jgi:hypothetical protein
MPAASSSVFALNVTNTLAIDRPHEVIQMNLTLPDSTVTHSTNFTVRRQSDNTEVLSGPLNSTVELYPSGYIHRMRIAFQDDFNAIERKGYFINAGERTGLMGDMSYQIIPGWIIVADGIAADKRVYRLSTDNAADIDSYNRGIRVYYNHSTYPYEAQSGILIRVAGDQTDVDQVSFQMGWGSPDDMTVDVNNVMVSAHLVYRSSYAIQWGRGMTSQLQKDTDIIWANITVNFYNDNSMVDAYVSKKVNEKFYNHNGFIMESSALLAGVGNYEYIFGTPEHTRQWANTTSLNWVQDATKLVGLNVGNRSAPTAGDLDNDFDYDLVVGSKNGTLTGYRNTGGPTNPTYVVDQSLVPVGGPWDNYSIPALADLDADGDLDMLIGLENGTLVAFRNMGSVSAPSWAKDDTLLIVIGPPPFPPGLHSAPELADMDADGDYDLLIGHEDGTFNYFVNGGTPISPLWNPDDTVFSYLNHGSTLKPGTYATPDIADVNRDGKIDFVSGQDYTSMGSLVYFENEGDNSNPRFTRLYPAMFNSVRGPGYWIKNYSVPEFVDLTGDGLLDIVNGGNDGTLLLWVCQGYTLPERHANTMQPLENGSYRFYYDQDANDGQYVTRNYSTSFDGWYVVSNPQKNASIFRFVPDFARYVYRDRYSGEMYPWAGGNTSYYPFLPQEDGRITKGMLVTRVGLNATNYPYGSGGTYLSQTGTAGGYIKGPMAAMEMKSRECLIMELPYDGTAALYDQLALIMMNPLKIEGEPDFTLRSVDITSNPTDPADGMDVTLTANIWNLGHNGTTNVQAEFFNGDPMAGGIKIGMTKSIPFLPADGVARVNVTWNTTGAIGPIWIYVAVDRAGLIDEMDEGNNAANRLIMVTRTGRAWTDEIMISQSDYNDIDPDIQVDSMNRVWVAWHDFNSKENYNIYSRSYDGVSWSGVEPIAEGYKHTSAPSLAPSPNGDMWVMFSSNLKEYEKFITSRNGIYYWSMKFDLYSSKHTVDGWQVPERFTQSMEKNYTDHTPRGAITPDGRLWTVYRNTDIQLYQHGYQMYNIPYQNMNISARVYDGITWSGQQDVDDRTGSQGFWGGPTLAVAPNGTLWAVYESELSQTQWEIYASWNSGAGWSAPIRLTTSGTQDLRPSTTFDTFGNLWVAWQSDWNGNNDIFAKYFNGATWSSNIQITTDPGEDMKPSISANPDGHVFIAWDSDRTGNKDIFVKVYNLTGWSPDIQVTTDPHSDEQVKVANGQNATWLVWESDRRGLGNKDIYVKAFSGLPPYPDIQRPGPSRLKAALEGANYEDLRLTWNLSADDWYSHIVKYYWIMCGDNYSKTGMDYVPILSVPPGTGSAVLGNYGHARPNNVFCFVKAQSTYGNSTPSNQAGAYKMKLTGHNLVSSPLILEDTSASSVLATGLLPTSNFLYARYYDARDAGDPWKEFSKTGYRELERVDNGQGIWVGSSGTTQITVAGIVPDYYQVVLRAGWNLVGYPSMTPMTVSDALAGLPVLRIEGEDPTCPPYNLRVLGGNDLMTPGHGYWIYVSSDSMWMIDG